MTFLIRMLSAAALLIGLAQPLAAAAETDTFGYDSVPTHGVTCTNAAAEWQSAMAGRDDLRTVAGKPVDRPEGTRTNIFRCETVGHVVRINFGYVRVYSMACGMANNRVLSAWVDGVKVMDQHQWGDFDACTHQDARQLASVRVDAGQAAGPNLTTCDRLLASRRAKPYAPAELKPGQTAEADRATTGRKAPIYYIVECRTQALDLPAGAHEASFTRTPPGYDLVLDTSPVCHDETVSSPTVLTGFGDMISPQLSLDMIKPIPDSIFTRAELTFDVDNDGTPDRLTDTIMQVFLSNQYSWISGKTGERHDITGAMMDDDAPTLTAALRAQLPFEDPATSLLQFYSIDNSTYLYAAASHQIEHMMADPDDMDEDTAIGGADYGPTRRLYALHADGTATKLCAWAPRKRPEEFL